MIKNNRHFSFLPLMPDGAPAPAVMLEDDVIKFLRLEEVGVRNAQNSLRYYREIGKLRPTCIARHNVCTLDAVMDFLESITKKNGKGT